MKATISIRGVAQKKAFKNLRIDSSIGIRSYRVLNRPAIFYLISSFEPQNPLKLRKKTAYFRDLLISISRSPELLFNRKWIAFEIHLEYEPNPELQSFKIDFVDCANKRTMSKYISRSVSFSGFTPNSLNLSLEYELTRNWRNYEFLLINARTKIDSQVLPSRHGDNVKLSRDEIGNWVNSWIFEYFTENHITSPSTLKPAKSISGKFSPINLGNAQRTSNPLVTFIEIKSAEVLHGTLVHDGSNYYFSDRLKTPSKGGGGNLIPGLSYCASNKLITFSPHFELSNLESAIFLGGTRNYMHFVIEDLQKVLASKELDIPLNVPIIVSGNLSREILESIEVLSSRRLIVVNDFESLKIDNLHFPIFENHLPETMQGQIEYRDRLFDSQALTIARQKLTGNDSILGQTPRRLLIKREPGLFRPMTNIDNLCKLLETEFGFQSVFLGNLSLEEARNLFEGVEILVGEYGAGLAHMIFLEPGSAVIEIRGELEKHAEEYRALGLSLDLNYHVSIGRNQKISKHGLMKGPFKSNTEEITSYVQKIINMKGSEL